MTTEMNTLIPPSPFPLNSVTHPVIKRLCLEMPAMFAVPKGGNSDGFVSIDTSTTTTTKTTTATEAAAGGQGSHVKRSQVLGAM